MAMDRPCLLMGGGLQSQIQSNRLSTHGRVIVFAALCVSRQANEPTTRALPYSRLLSWSGLFAGVRSESIAAMNPASVAEGDGNRSFAPLGFRQVDEPFHLDWQLRFIRGSTTEVDCRFYLRFGQAVIGWDVANQHRPFLESRLDGRPQTLNGKNYAVRF
jgi:hypothetical protein